jgi:hypothetical protein
VGFRIPFLTNREKCWESDGGGLWNAFPREQLFDDQEWEEVKSWVDKEVLGGQAGWNNTF